MDSHLFTKRLRSVALAACLGTLAAPADLRCQSLWDAVIWGKGGDIVTAGFDGSNRHVVVDDPAAQLGRPAVSPDGARLAFLRSPFAGGAEICVLDASGQVCAAAPGFTYGLGWGAGSEIVYYTRNEGDSQIWQIDFSNPAPVAQLFLDVAGYRSFGLSVSGDGQKMALIHDPSNNTPNNYLSVYSFSGGTETTILGPDGLRDFFPDYSPTRGEITWARGTVPNTSGDPLDIWVIHDDGSGALNLTNTPALHEQGPHFSLDGEFVFYSVPGQGYLWVVDRTASSPAMAVLDLETTDGNETLFDIACDYPAGCNNLSEFSIFSNAWVSLAQGTAVNAGKVGSLGSVEGNHRVTITDGVQLGTDLQLGRAFQTEGDVLANGFVQLGLNCEIGGDLKVGTGYAIETGSCAAGPVSIEVGGSPAGPLPAIPVPAACAGNSDDRNVASGLTLDPGVYGEVSWSTNNPGPLTLGPGDYVFKRLKGTNGAEIHIDLGMVCPACSGGRINICVEDTMAGFGNSSKVKIVSVGPEDSPAKVFVNVQGEKASFANGVRFDGTLLVPSGEIRFVNGCQVSGALYAGGPVRLGNGCEIDFVPADPFPR